MLSALIFLGATIACAQDAENRFPNERAKPDFPKSIKDMLAKKRIEQDKKEHEELLKNGADAIEISEQLERSFAQNSTLSANDRLRLDELAGLVRKIRKGVGASDDGVDDKPSNKKPDPDEPEEVVEEKPSNLEAAFKALQSTTVKLVDELKKTTRFTVSAVAIQSSNTLLRIVRFIRTGK